MPKLTQEQEKTKNEQILIGESFQQLTHSKAWEYIEKYFQAQVQNLNNEIILSENKDISEFEGLRREVIGLRKFVLFVKNNVDFYEKQTARPTSK